ncbi:MAG TPA: plastocyanin/azurin family copper-binding protein [Terriglobales bacterium]|nr:plastocyanin/azurin family copper-binding protein [Terriglobales bacterium]
MKFIVVTALSLVTCFLLMTAQSSPPNQVVEQKDKTFVYKGAKVTTLKIKVGTTIEFKNLDPYFHNVFSLSEAKLFDLGSYPQGQSRSVTFDKPGKVEVECAIHPLMKMTVEVK